MYDFLLLLAKTKSSLDNNGPVDKGLSLSWALVIFSVVLGLLITLSPAKRTTEIKMPHED